MALRVRTIPRILQGLGYRTYGVGKWHLGHNVEFHPNLRGFDRWYGMWAGSRSFYASSTENTVFQNQMVPDFASEQSPVYVTDRIGNRAVEFIDEHLAAAPDDPLFMFVSFTAVHSPMDIIPGDPRFARLQNEFSLTAADYQNSPIIHDGSNQATVDQNRYELAAMTLDAATVCGPRMIWRPDPGSRFGRAARFQRKPPSCSPRNSPTASASSASKPLIPDE
jgi:arylsulfatase A-like enzyme